MSLNLAAFRRQLLADTAKSLGWELLQPAKLRIRVARYKHNNATRARKERRELADATAKSTEFLFGNRFCDC